MITVYRTYATRNFSGFGRGYHDEEIASGRKVIPTEMRRDELRKGALTDKERKRRAASKRAKTARKVTYRNSK